MATDRIWLLVRDYPPHKSGGVRRVEALCRGLRTRGFAVDLFACQGDASHPYPATAARIRRGSARFKLGWLYRGVVRWAGWPDENLLDWPGLLRAAQKALKHGAPRPDLIIASAPPYSLFFAAWGLSRQLQVPWIADFRDPWTEHPSFVPATSIHRRWLETLDQGVVQNASGILAATESMAHDLRRRARDQTPVHTFLNGFDLERFRAKNAAHVSRADLTQQQGAARIKVGFYGSFYGPIDPEPLVRAVARAGAEIEHAGADFDGRLAHTAKQYDVSVRSLGVLTPQQAVDYMMRADVLAMVLPDDERWAYCRTQKLAEYLASGRPILALVPRGEAAELIERHQAGIAVRPGDVEGAAAAIQQLATRATRHDIPTELDWNTQVERTVEFLRERLISRKAKSSADRDTASNGARRKMSAPRA